MAGSFTLSVKTVQTLKVLLPSTEVFRAISCQSVLLMTCYRGSHPSSNRFGNLVLNIKNIFQGTVPLFRPEVVVFFRINQLGGDPNSVAPFSNASFDDVSCPKFTGNLFEILGLSPVGKTRVSRNDREGSPEREIGDDVFCDSIREVFLLRITTHI